MLVWNAAGETPNVGVPVGWIEAFRGLRAPARYLVYAWGVFSGSGDVQPDVPGRLSSAMIGALKAMAGRIADNIETKFSQWQQYVACASLAAIGWSRALSDKNLTARSIGALQGVKAFFITHKVDGRNAP